MNWASCLLLFGHPNVFLTTGCKHTCLLHIHGTLSRERVAQITVGMLSWLSTLGWFRVFWTVCTSQVVFLTHLCLEVIHWYHCLPHLTPAMEAVNQASIWNTYRQAWENCWYTKCSVVLRGQLSRLSRACLFPQQLWGAAHVYPSFRWQGSSVYLPGWRICCPHSSLLLPFAFVVNVYFILHFKNWGMFWVSIKFTNSTFWPSVPYLVLLQSVYFEFSIGCLKSFVDETMCRQNFEHTYSWKHRS